MTLKEVIEILEKNGIDYEFLGEFEDAINISISIERDKPLSEILEEDGE